MRREQQNSPQDNNSIVTFAEDTPGKAAQFCGRESRAALLCAGRQGAESGKP
jgi:hypothetical protein